MCGIVGLIAGQLTAEDSQRVESMLVKQRHRGPDSCEFQILDDQSVLGHNRLSIIDLSEAANQPFFSSNKRFCIVFNGEIYNYIELKEELRPYYTFTTQSDTEVLLAAFITWGDAMLDRLIGMFAFAIYDRQTKELLVARDRFGVKPFYYTQTSKGEFIFASEIKAIHAAGVEKVRNEVMWSGYLVKGLYQYENQTFWEGILQLRAGHFMRFKVDAPPESIQQSRWYDFVGNVEALQADSEVAERSETAHLAHYKSLLEESIALRFRSDVPVGFNLSGGLDSSLLLSLVDELKPDTPVEGFTFYCNDPRYDELPWVEGLVAEKNKPLNRVLMQAEDVPDLSDTVMHFQDEPYGGIPTLAYSKIFQQARAKGTIVLLDGQGMDEAWAGYDYYHRTSDSIVQGVKKSPVKPEVLKKEFSNKAMGIVYPTPFEDDLLNKQYRDLFYTKIPRALRFNDRISMMHSTELREPFLDHRLVEYAFALPLEMKVKDGSTKWGLRKLAKGYIKNDLILAPKRPLQTPQREWLTEDLIDWIEGEVKKLTSHPWFNATKLSQCWADFKKSEKENTFFLWQWLSVKSDA
ncbi:MAG: asparagine synthase (glutamine-hydrolyzing) [Roseivirga sp.]|nr:asparagine synthase (glutamine-hydrolyzing) [Roseivirga sp.]